MLTFRFDRGPGRGIGATPIEETPEGYKVYCGVAAFGDVVLEYPEDGVNEFAPTADVMGPGIAESIIARPFTILHPEDLLDANDPDTIQSKTVGTVRAARANLQKKPPELEVEVVVWTRPAQEDIESGRIVELSPGYQRDPEKAPRGATHGGKPYHVVQRKRRYNHLSGVYSARGVTPDGRRARLDESDDGLLHDRIGPSSGRLLAATPIASAAYAHLSMDDLIIADPAPDADTDRQDADPFTDAGGDPPPPMDAPPPVVAEGGEDIEVAGGEAEVPAALAAFSPEDAEILKQLSPEGLAALMLMAKQQTAEAAEQAIMAAPPGAAEVEVGDAVPPPQVEGAPADAGAVPPPVAAAPADATAPAAPRGLTESIVMDMISKAVGAVADKFGKQFDEAMKAMGKAPEDRKDNVPTVAAPQAAAARIDAKEVAAQIAERRRMDAAFVEHARKDGHLGETEAATVKAAATKMYGVIAEHLPDLAPMAKAALADPKRRDGDFVTIYQAAEKKRREALMDDAASIFVAFNEPDPEAAAGLTPDILKFLQ